MPDPDVKISASHLLGVVLDAVGQYAEALRWLRKAKALCAKERILPRSRKLMTRWIGPPKIAGGVDTGDSAALARRSGCRSDRVYRWPFWRAPRSGTTLIEQILASASGDSCI